MRRPYRGVPEARWPDVVCAFIVVLAAGYFAVRIFLSVFVQH